LTSGEAITFRYVLNSIANQTDDFIQLKHPYIITEIFKLYTHNTTELFE